MAQHELVMPKMGESVAEATIIKWVKNEGDKIKIDETVLEIATDKVDSEIPSSFEGVLVKKLFKEGDVVQVGTVIALISSDVHAAASAPQTQALAKQEVAASQTASPVKEVAHATGHDFSQSNRFYSPLVKNIAKEEGISVQELEKIAGSGKDGRVTKTDILSYIPNRGAQQATVVEERIEKPVAKPSSNGNGQSTVTINKPAVSLMAGDEIIEMDRMRKLIADHMVMSKHVSPHVTSFVEADVTNMVLWRDKIKGPFEKREGEKMTFTPLFVEAVAKAIKDFPMVNVSVDGQNIIKRK